MALLLAIAASAAGQGAAIRGPWWLDAGATDVAALAGAQWVPVDGGTTQNLRDIHFPSAAYGWIGGENLTILRSTTGGLVWIPAPPNPGWSVTAADCCMSVSARMLPSHEAWFAGPAKVMSYGSTSISGLYSYGEVRLYAVFPIPGTTTAWYGGSTTSTGGSFRLYRRNSSGTLMIFFPFTSGSVYDIFFVNADTGWAVGTFGNVVRITSGSASQPTITVSSPSTANLNGIFMIDAQLGWIVGDSGTILRTTNGTSWSKRPSGTVNRLRDVSFRDSLHGAIAGDAGLILVTSDGGTTWNVEPSGTSSNLHGIAWAGSTALAVGDHGTILMRIEAGPPKRRSVRK